MVIFANIYTLLNKYGPLKSSLISPLYSLSLSSFSRSDEDRKNACKIRTTLFLCLMAVRVVLFDQCWRDICKTCFTKPLVINPSLDIKNSSECFRLCLAILRISKTRSIDGKLVDSEILLKLKFKWYKKLQNSIH